MPLLSPQISEKEFLKDFLSEDIRTTIFAATYIGEKGYKKFMGMVDIDDPVYDSILYGMFSENKLLYKNYTKSHLKLALMASQGHQNIIQFAFEEAERQQINLCRHIEIEAVEEAYMKKRYSTMMYLLTRGMYFRRNNDHDESFEKIYHKFRDI